MVATNTQNRCGRSSLQRCNTVTDCWLVEVASLESGVVFHDIMLFLLEFGWYSSSSFLLAVVSLCSHIMFVRFAFAGLCLFA